MKKTFATITAVAAIALPMSASAQYSDDPADYPQPTDDGCELVWFQGAPAKICDLEPDPTNCYTGDYQGAPIEVCMPTGHTLPPGTIDRATGEPPIIHESKVNLDGTPRETTITTTVPALPAVTLPSEPAESPSKASNQPLEANTPEPAPEACTGEVVPDWAQLIQASEACTGFVLPDWAQLIQANLLANGGTW